MSRISCIVRIFTYKPVLANAPLFACDGGVKINDVLITNWYEPGDTWWDNVQAKRTEPLINATISMALTFDEYEQLIAKHDNRPNKLAPGVK